MWMLNKRKRIDSVYNTVTYLAAALAVFSLGLIIGFVLLNGLGLLNIGLLTGDYHAHYYNAGIETINEFSDTERPTNLDEDTYYSEKWGIALSDTEDREGNQTIKVAFVADDSPLLNVYDINENDYDVFKIEVGNIVKSIKYYDASFAIPRYGAEHMINTLNQVNDFREFEFTDLGGGIRGSLITTLIIIGLTLVIALPIGIFTAIYLNEFAKKGPITSLLRSMIEVLTGVPSIIYGLMGLAVFVPLTLKYTNAQEPNLISGSLTLAVILLPVIIRSTEESLKVVPDGFRSASLALGANHTQTTFKVVLPNALPGMMTATLLAIGRIIGESAALIFAIGTYISDSVNVNNASTTLAVHIWKLMVDEPANIELASTISIIILMIVLVLNLTVKLFSRRYMKKFS